MEIINIDIIPGKMIKPIAHASQFDRARYIRINLYENGAPYTLTGSETVSVIVRKPDDHLVTSELTNTHGNYVDLMVFQQMAAVAGTCLGEINITNGGQSIGTGDFFLEVEPSPEDGGLPSESEINNLQTQVDAAVANALASMYDSANVLFDSTPTNGHTTPYTVTSDGIHDAIQNITAAGISYDNTGTDIRADNVQGAINEIAGEVMGLDASTVPFDSTGTSLHASDVETAIKELDTNVATINAENVAFINSSFRANNVKDALIEVQESIPTTDRIINDSSNNPIANASVYYQVNKVWTSNASAMEVGDTFTLPASVRNKTFTLLYAHRYLTGGSVLIPNVLITNGNLANGVYIQAREGQGWLFNISTAGVVTLVSKGDSVGEPYVNAVGFL